MPASHQDSKDGRLTEYKLEQLSSIAHKYTTLLSHSNMSYPSTLTYKNVLNLKDLITKHLGWLGGVLQCV